jgi:Predicted phosphoribosyltransferases
VILVDDGMATGYTAIAGAKFIKERKAKKLILAVPVCSENAYNLVRENFDKIVCLEIVKSIFFAVGMFYENFVQISDGELLEFFKHS